MQTLRDFTLQPRRPAAQAWGWEVPAPECWACVGWGMLGLGELVGGSLLIDQTRFINPHWLPRL